MLEFDFMRRALIAGFMLSITIPIIGVIMINRKTSMIGDALSHTSIAGVGFGLILGIDPVIGAIIICVISAFLIEKIREVFPQQGDMATAVIMSGGLGLAAILSDFAPGGNTFESYLFGSISSVTTNDIAGVFVVFLLVLSWSIIYYNALLDLGVDSNLARISGVRVKRVNGIFTLLSAITIAISCKIVGALLVISLIVLPVATALIPAKSYKSSLIISIILGVIYTMTGICCSYYFDVKPGGSIVISAVIGLIIISLLDKVYKKLKTSKQAI